MAYEEQDKAKFLYITFMVYLIITQTRCTMAFLVAVISEESRRRHPSTSGSRPQGIKSQACTERKIRSDLMERIHARVMRLSIE